MPSLRVCSVKRIIVWVDSSDENAPQVREQLKEYLPKVSGSKVTIFKTREVMES
jgi:hypothetical protein